MRGREWKRFSVDMRGRTVPKVDPMPIAPPARGNVVTHERGDGQEHERLQSATASSESVGTSAEAEGSRLLPHREDTAELLRPPTPPPLYPLRGVKATHQCPRADSR